MGDICSQKEFSDLPGCRGTCQDSECAPFCPGCAETGERDAAYGLVFVTLIGAALSIAGILALVYLASRPER